MHVLQRLYYPLLPDPTPFEDDVMYAAQHQLHHTSPDPCRLASLSAALLTATQALCAAQRLYYQLLADPTPFEDDVVYAPEERIAIQTKFMTAHTGRAEAEVPVLLASMCTMCALLHALRVLLVGGSSQTYLWCRICITSQTSVAAHWHATRQLSCWPQLLTYSCSRGPLW